MEPVHTTFDGSRPSAQANLVSDDEVTTCSFYPQTATEPSKEAYEYNHCNYDEYTNVDVVPRINVIVGI